MKRKMSHRELPGAVETGLDLNKELDRPASNSIHIGRSSANTGTLSVWEHRPQRERRHQDTLPLQRNAAGTLPAPDRLHLGTQRFSSDA